MTRERMTPYLEDLIERLCDVWNETAYDANHYPDAGFPLPDHVEKIELRDDGDVWIVWEGGDEELLRSM